MEPLREIRNRLLNGWQLSKMHTFEVAARHQSFALAAEELSLSPSAGTLTLYSRPSIAQCWLVPALGDFTRR